MITEIRKHVSELIENNKDKEIKCNSDYQSAGIYMIYVDCFESDTIIPFYIGQTNDFQDRHKKHLTELMSLNRLNRECYEYAVLKDLYNGKARTCKIFTYMVNHKCTLDDWHMIILEEIPNEEERLQKEREYIDSLYAPFFGFNQLNYVVDSIALRFGGISKEQLVETAKNDIRQLLQLSHYGFSLYNWYRVCETLSKLIPLDTALEENFTRISSAKADLEAAKIKLSRMRFFCNYDAEDKAWKSCVRTVREYFAQNKLTSKDMQRLVVKVWLFEREEDKAKLEKYFARTKAKTSCELYDLLQQKHGKKINMLKAELAYISENYAVIEDKVTELSLLVFQQLIPREYISHPLGALGLQDPIEPSRIKNNECVINVEFTCFKADVHHDFYPEICRIDYCLCRDEEIHARTVWVKNSLSNFFDRDDVYYYERGFRAGPYNAFLVGDVDSHIPVAMEYRNGINECSFREIEAENAEDVLLEINRLIDDATQIVYTTNGYKSTILREIDRPILKNMLLSKKLRKLCKS